jgi:hypothetical protein
VLLLSLAWPVLLLLLLEDLDELDLLPLLLLDDLETPVEELDAAELGNT